MRNKVNRQIIKALSLGISASMALQPITALASEDTVVDTEGVVDTIVETDEFSVKADDSVQEIEEASEALVGVVANDNTDGETEGTLGENAESESEGTSGENAESESEGASGEEGESASEGTDPDNTAPSTEVSDAKTETLEVKNIVDDIDKNPTIGKDVDLSDASEKLASAADYLKQANGALEEAKEAISAAVDANKQVLDDIESTNDNANDAIDVIENGTVNKNVNGEPVINENGEPELNHVEDFEEAKEAASDSASTYDDAISFAGDATDQYEDVLSDSNDYVNNGTALTDVTGEILQRIEAAAEIADGNLQEAQNRVTEAETDLEKAQKKKESAEKAFQEAEALYNEAVKSYNKLSDQSGAVAEYGKEIEDDEIDHLSDTASSMTTANAKMHNANYYFYNPDEKYDSAKKALKDAEKLVNEKLSELLDAKYDELVELQKAYNEASDEGKDTARKELAKKVIEYYGLVDVEGTISNITFTDSQPYSITDTIEIDGKTCYISGYNADKTPIYSEVPLKQAVKYDVTRTVEEDGEKKEITESVVRIFDVGVDNNGKISIHELVESNVGNETVSVIKREHVFREAVIEHYEDSLRNTVIIPEDAVTSDITNDDVKTGIHVLDSDNIIGSVKTDTKPVPPRVRDGKDGFEEISSQVDYEYKKGVSIESVPGQVKPPTPGANGVKYDGFVQTVTTTYSKTSEPNHSNNTSAMLLSELQKVISELEKKHNKTTTGKDGEVKTEKVVGTITKKGNSDKYQFTYKVVTTTTYTAVTKTLYGSNDYDYIPGSDKESAKFYELGGYSNSTASSLSNSVALYDTAKEYQEAAKKAVDDAQAGFDDANAAYLKAEQELEQASDAVKQLKSLSVTIDSDEVKEAKGNLEKAKKMLDDAAQNKENAENALEMAQTAKVKADAAVETAKEAKVAAYSALSGAQTAKKKADANRAAEEARKAAEEAKKASDEAKEAADGVDGKPSDNKADEEAQKESDASEQDVEAGDDIPGQNRTDTSNPVNIVDESVPLSNAPATGTEAAQTEPTVGTDTTQTAPATDQAGIDTAAFGETTGFTSTGDASDNSDSGSSDGVSDAGTGVSATTTVATTTTTIATASSTTNTATTSAIPAATATSTTANQADDAQVLGARADSNTSAAVTNDVQKSEVVIADGEAAKAATPATDNTKTPDTKASTESVETTIVDEETAKAAAPVQEEQKNFPLWLVILAAIAGVSVEEYVRRKNQAAKARANSGKKSSKDLTA